MNKVFIFVASLLLFLCCANPSPKFLIENYEAVKPAKIAVLPLTNETTDMDGPEIIRKIMNEELMKNGYDTLETSVITTALRNEGITDAGQLNTISNEKLKQVLPADAIMSGDLFTFRHLITGVYNDRTVETRFNLLALEAGQELWRDERKISKKKTGGGCLGFVDGLIWEVGKKIYEKSVGTPLGSETKELVATHLATLPWGPNRHDYPPWLWNNPNSKAGFSYILGSPSLIGVQLKSWKSRIGFQADISLMPSARLLYAWSTEGMCRAYWGIRIGYDYFSIWSDDDESQLGISPFLGLEFLHWKYSSFHRSHSFSINVGWSLECAAGPFIEISNGFYIK